jgi:hypothetical protein
VSSCGTTRVRSSLWMSRRRSRRGCVRLRGRNPFPAEYCRAHLGSEWKKPFAGCSHSVRALRPLTACTPLRTHAYAGAYAFLRAVCAARLRVLFVLRLTEGHRAGEDVRARCARSRRMRCPSGQPPLALLLLSASALAARNGCDHRHGHPATAGRRSSVPRAPLLYGRREAAAVSDQGSGLGHRRRRRTSALSAHARCRSQAPGRRTCLSKAALRAASALRAARVRVSVISAAPRPTYHGPGDRAAPRHAAF